MNRILKERLVGTAIVEINGVLRDHINRIDDSMALALEDYDGEKPFKYPVSLGLVIQPMGDACKVSAKISYSVRHVDESVGQIVDPNQMKMSFKTEEEPVAE